MKRWLGLSLLVLSTAALPAMANHGWSDPAIDQRQERIGNRIERNFRSGELSRQEYRRLRQELRDIDRQEHYFLSDGRLTPRERDHLLVRLENLSRQVFAESHDGDRRYGYYNDRAYPDRRY